MECDHEFEFVDPDVICKICSVEWHTETYFGS